MSGAEAQIKGAATAPASAARKPPKRKRWNKEALAGYLFIAPGLLHALVFIVGVVLVSAVVSTWDWDLSSAPQFVGLQNYQDMLSDRLFLISLWNTLVFVVMSVPTTIVLALGLAMAANTKLKGLGFFRTAYFFPYVASMVSVAIVFRWLFATDAGLLNGFLGWFGINPVEWLGNCSTALPAVALVSVWKGLGWNMTLFLAGLAAIPSHLYEAAALDGAGKWRQFRDITWPLLSPTTFFVTITAMLGSFQAFDSAYVLTGGGPGTCTYLYLFYVWQQGFQLLNMGYAAALSWALFIMILVFTFIQFKFLNKRVHYELG